MDRGKPAGANPDRQYRSIGLRYGLAATAIAKLRPMTLRGRVALSLWRKSGTGIQQQTIISLVMFHLYGPTFQNLSFMRTGENGAAQHKVL